MQIILRDDDTSFFTSPDRLEQIYGSLWARGVPVSLAVIPAHYAAIEIPADPPFIDPNIPPDYRGRREAFPVTANEPLCAYLNDLARRGLVEICLHGHTHDWMEFKTDDMAVIAQKLRDGLAILNEAFPGVPIHTFLSPYDGMSAAAVKAVLAAGMVTNLHPVNVPTGLPEGASDSAYTPARAYRMGGGTLITSPLDDHIQDPQAWLDFAARAGDDHVLVAVNHWYMFYNDWAEPNAAAFGSWSAFIDTLTACYPAQFTTFSRYRAGA